MNKPTLTQLQRYAPTIGLVGCISMLILQLSSIYFIKNIASFGSEGLQLFYQFFQPLNLITYITILCSFILIFKGFQQFKLMKLTATYLGLYMLWSAIHFTLSFFREGIRFPLHLIPPVQSTLTFITLILIIFSVFKIQQLSMPSLIKLRWIIIIKLLTFIINFVSNYRINYLLKRGESYADLAPSTTISYYITLTFSVILFSLCCWFFISIKSHYKDKGLTSIA